MSRSLPIACLAAALAWPAAALGGDGAVEILSAVGEVRSGGAPVTAGQRLAASAARPVLVAVPRGASLSALLTARGRPMALAAAGPLLLRLLGPRSDVVRLEGEGALRVAAHDAALAASGWSVKLGVSRLSLRSADGRDMASFLIERDAWSTIVLDGDHLYVLEGGAMVTSTGRALGRLLERIAPAPSAPFLLGARQRARLGLARATRGEGSPPAEVLARLSALETPAPWVPDAATVTPAEVKRARRSTELQRQAAREAASCGCTESRTSGTGQWANSRSTVNPLERASGVITVRVRGMPRGLP